MRASAGIRTRVLARRASVAAPVDPRRVPAPEAIAALAPGERVWLTTGHTVVAADDGVSVGGFAAAESTPAALRDAVLAAQHARRPPAARPELTAAYEHYWQSFLTPCLQAGYRPPLFAPWRIPESLLPEDTGALEAELLGDPALVPLPWERFATAVLVPYAREVARNASLHAQTVAELAALSGAAGDDPDRLFVLSCALVVALADAGWEIEAVPGDPVRAVTEDASLLPFDVPYALARDRRASWREFIEAEGIAGLPLCPALPSVDAAALELEALMAAPPAAPDGTRVELVLAGPRSHRVRAAAVAFVAAVLGAPVALLLLAAPATFDVPAWAGAVMAGAGAALAAGLVWWTRTRLRLAGATGRLLVDGERVVVEHPVLLRRPFELPRSSLSAVALDLGPVRRDERARRVTLPVSVAPWEGTGALGFLWTDGIGSMVPLLAVEPCAPNVALVFAQRVPAPDVRRRRRRADHVGGLLLSAAAVPPEAREALDRLGLATEVTRDDALRLHDASARR